MSYSKQLNLHVLPPILLVAKLLFIDFIDDTSSIFVRLPSLAILTVVIGTEVDLLIFHILISPPELIVANIAE